MNICIIGTGYVGLVTAACFAEMGNEVHCVDINATLIDNLNNGHIHIYEPGLEPLVSRNMAQERLHFSTDIAQGIKEALFVFICVGTPAGDNGACDLSHVLAVAKTIGQVIDDYKIIVNKSTVPVGTADRVREVITANLTEQGRSMEFDVVSNPEFLKEGDAVSDFMKPDRIIAGTDNVRTAKLLETLYAPFARSRDKMLIMDVRSAEMTKYAANCMLATKISFINEMAMLCEKVGADISLVRQGIGADHRIGYHFIYPGLGYGGSCFPKDVRALINTGRENDCALQLMHAVDQVNTTQKQAVLRMIAGHFGGPDQVRGKTIAIWGLSFKANTDDIRESAAIDTIMELNAWGASVRAFDPVAGANAQQACADMGRIEIMDHQYDVLEGADGLAIMTDWNQFRNPNFERMRKLLKTPLIFDGRNLYDPINISNQGFTGYFIGKKSVLA